MCSHFTDEKLKAQEISIVKNSNPYMYVGVWMDTNMMYFFHLTK